MGGTDQRREPSSVEISRVYSRGAGGRRPLILVPGHELYLQPLSAMIDAELLAVAKHNFRFAPCKRLYQQIIRRGIWEWALRYPLLLVHARCFLEVVQRAPYPNPTDLNRECGNVIRRGIAGLISKKLGEAEDARLTASMQHSIFERTIDVHVPVTIWIFPPKRRRQRVTGKSAKAKAKKQS